MRSEHERAPGRGAEGREDQAGTGSTPSLPPTRDKVRDLDLLGAMLRCQTPADIKDIMFTVPAEAFSHPLDTAIWRAAEALADNGVCDPVAVVQTVVTAGLWPRDLHHEVTVRVVDAITTCRFDPDEWVTPALDVLYAHGRRTTASKLSHVARILPSARLHDVARELFEAAEFVETVAHWIDHNEFPPGVAA